MRGPGSAEMDSDEPIDVCSGCLELHERVKHLEAIAALRHPELYGDPEATARQLAGQGEPQAPPTTTTTPDPAIVDPW